MRHTRISLALAAFVLAAGLAVSRGEFMNNSVKVPVDRVVANVEAWIKDKPKDAQAYYVLARIHAMAWAYGPDLNLWRPGVGGLDRGATVGADPFNGQLPGFAPYDSVEVRRDAQKKDVTADDAKHLQESIKNYTKAIELDPKNAIYELGLGWIIQEAGKVAKNLPDGFGMVKYEVPDAERATYAAAIKKLGDPDAKVRDDASALLLAALPKSLTQLKALKTTDAEVIARVESLLCAYWDLQALEHYRKAYALRIDQDLKRGGGLKMGDSALAEEAGEAILVLLKSYPQAAKGTEAKDVAANVQTLKNKPQAITPIVFAMPGTPAPQRIGDLEDTSKRVSFDLAGDTVPRQWTWLKDGTALLVWDPAHTGTITNGRQLFGSRTWWVFFRDGYEALCVLDDNCDGQLTGNELQGIAVWIDKNGDGISQKGEVLTLEQAGITAIATRATETDGILSINKGITFSNGQSVPSFDWVTSPVTRDHSTPDK